MQTSTDSPHAEVRAPDLLWHSSAPWDHSGYGHQTDLVVSGLEAGGVDVDVSALLPTGGPLRISGRRIWPSADLSLATLEANADAAFGTDGDRRVVTFTDLNRLERGTRSSLDLACWLPLGFDPVPPGYLEWLRLGPVRVIAMSRWAQAALADADVDAAYIPLGVDTAVHRPPTAVERSDARARFGLPADAFVVGVVAVNNEWQANRKCLPETLAAFGELRRRQPDAVLMLHADLTEDMRGIDLHRVVDSLGLPPGSVVATHPNRHRLGLPDDEMAQLYWTFDVLLAASGGEGFGLPVVEAQAAGCPVIVSDFSAQPELVGAGRVVSGQRRWAPWASSWLFTPFVGELVDALVEAYDAGPGVRPAALELAGRFDVDLIVQSTWLPYVRSWIEGGPVDQK